MKRWAELLVGIGMVLAVILMVGSLTMLFIVNPARERGRMRAAGAGGAGGALTPDHVFEGLRVPEFALTDQDGRPVTHEALEGRVTIVDFIFTNCPFVCPEMTGVMAELHGELGPDGVRLMSISVDPVHDTPEALREYAARYGADTSRWAFLTGDFDRVRAIAHDGLGFALQADESVRIETRDGGAMFNILHPSKLVLVGPDRQVLGMYDFGDRDRVDALRARAKAAAAAVKPRG